MSAATADEPGMGGGEAAAHEYLASLRRSTTSPTLLAAIDSVEAAIPPAPAPSPGTVLGERSEVSDE